MPMHKNHRGNKAGHLKGKERAMAVVPGKAPAHGLKGTRPKRGKP